MRIDVLRNFTVLISERNMTSAAKKLHISQPTLSRQMAGLEEDLGKQLYTREDGIIKPTVDGRILLDYAASIVELEDRARQDIAHSDERIAGSVYIGYGGTNALTWVFRAMEQVQTKHPDVRFNLFSGNTNGLIERVNQGSLDFMLECDLRERGRYHTMQLPGKDTLAVAVGKRNPLYGKTRVKAEDLIGQNLVISKQLFEGAAMREWAKEFYSRLHVSTYFDLGLGTIEMAEHSADCVVVYQELSQKMSKGSEIDFIPLDPPLFDTCGIVWRKNRQLSSAAQAFLNELTAVCAEAEG